MNFFDLNILKRDVNQNDLYNLFEPTFVLLSGVEQSNYVCGKEVEARMDLISNEVFRGVDEVDFLCSLNDIDNPLNIMEGDTIFYTSYGAIDSFRLRDAEIIDTRNLLLNSNKSSKIDKNRQKYVEENFSLPPTFNPTPKPAIQVEGNTIIIGR